MNFMNVDYSTKIPNNVNLSEDRQVLKALEGWHPGYMDWWGDMGPEGFQQSLVYLRTAYSVDPRGWAKFDYVKMPEYRWGILLAPQEENRVIPFGENYGKPAWQEVPGEHRATLRRLIVIQGDTEPASVEQQRHLGKTAPSLYDLRNLFQVNVEEGRHLWAMVYLLQKYFGRDGREEADDLLRRRSGDADSPRMLGAFNEATPDWLSFFMFTYFTDRDGKMQLHSRAIRLRSAVAHLPLHADRRGASHVRRRDRHQPRRAAHLRGDEGSRHHRSHRYRQGARVGGDRPADHPEEAAPALFAVARSVWLGGLDQRGECLQRRHQGRYKETQIDDDHQLKNATYPVLKLVDGVIKRVDEPALTALNMRLRDDYTQDCVKGMLRWNKVISNAGYQYKLTLPNVAFHRQIGEFKDIHATPEGVLIDDATWNQRKGEWLPTTPTATSSPR